MVWRVNSLAAINVLTQSFTNRLCNPKSLIFQSLLIIWSMQGWNKKSCSITNLSITNRILLSFLWFFDSTIMVIVLIFYLISISFISAVTNIADMRTIAANQPEPGELISQFLSRFLLGSKQHKWRKRINIPASNYIPFVKWGGLIYVWGMARQCSLRLYLRFF